MNAEQRAALREAAEKATPGAWEVIPDGDWGCEVVQKGRAYPVCMCEQDDGEVADANARYIALANPAAVLALLDECERMREALAIADSLPELVLAVSRAPLGDRLECANNALSAAHKRLRDIRAALEPGA